MLRGPVILFVLSISMAQGQGQVTFGSNNTELNQSFDWARTKALSYVHDDSDRVGYWYEAALPNREAFCMRDASHQAIGAEILGLSKHNLNMFEKFAGNISAEKDYCSYWEINRFNRPAPVDYESDNDFWYNLPANFDVIFNAYRLYRWTGNRAYIDSPVFVNFYSLSLKEYVDRWELGYDKVTARDRSMYAIDSKVKSRFGNKRGIPTYNEGGKGEAILGIDMTASLIAAYKAYAEILKLSGKPAEAQHYVQQGEREKKFLDDFWWDNSRNGYRSIEYADKSFDYFMVGDDQAFLHYLLYFDVLDDPAKISSVTNAYVANFKKLIVELKSYLPIIFYENGNTAIANQMIIDLCGVENKRRDYPENSFAVVEHITRGLMGINVEAASNLVSTLSRLEKADDWAELANVSMLSNAITVKHVGKNETTFTNHAGPSLMWRAQVQGKHEFLYVDGRKSKCSVDDHLGKPYAYCNVQVGAGITAKVSTYP